MIFQNVLNTSTQPEIQPYLLIKKASLPIRSTSVLSRNYSYTYNITPSATTRSLSCNTKSHPMSLGDKQSLASSLRATSLSTLMPGELQGLSLAISANTIPPTYYLVQAPSNSHSIQIGNSLSDTQHVVHLSSIEHCMPRAYIRICLAYRLEDSAKLQNVIDNLNTFVRKTVNAKPYLAGYVCPARSQPHNIGAVEIRFTDQDFLDYPKVSVKELSHKEMPYSYKELCEQGVPPSSLKPEVISALPEGTDEARTPVFRVQANITDGGIIVSLYLHHCISDGTGIGLLATGKVLNDDFTFERDLCSRGLDTPVLTERLAAFANKKSICRQSLSWSCPNQVNTRHLNHEYVTIARSIKQFQNSPGRGCILQMSTHKLDQLKADLHTICPDTQLGPQLSRLDCLQALLWQHMTLARIPSLSHAASCHSHSTSKLLTPVNIRQKLKDPLPAGYFGAAIDFACTEHPLSHLSDGSIFTLASTAASIHASIQCVDESYVRQAIALARSNDPGVDVRDLQASNMNRVTGADMYITSWARLEVYDADLGMGLGKPDFVRKPWSRDPGSCIVLPMDARRDFVEIVVQMTEADMGRLLRDQGFMKFVERVID